MSKSTTWILIISYVLGSLLEIFIFKMQADMVLRINVFMLLSILLGVFLGRQAITFLENKVGKAFKNDWVKAGVLILVYLLVYCLLVVILNPFPGLF